jgi:hypothetical protein
MTNKCDANVEEEVDAYKRSGDNPPDDSVVETFSGEDEAETAVCEATEDHDAAEPKVDVGEPTTLFWMIADIAIVVVASETGLDDCRSDNGNTEEMIWAQCQKNAAAASRDPGIRKRVN